MKKRFPRGYWESIDNVITHLQPYIEKLERLPKCKELSADGLSMLSKVISKYHGGYEVLSEKLGIPTADSSIDKKPRDYWTHEKSLEAIHKYLAQSDNPTIKPTKKELKIFNPSILTALGKFTLKQLLEDYQKFYGSKLSERKRKVKWNKEKIKKTILKLVDKFGFIPSNSELAELGLDGLRGVIDRTGGLNYYSKKLGVPTKKQFLGVKPSGYWEDIKNVKKEILPVIKKLGHFPSYPELIALEKTYLQSAINAHGGIKLLAKTLDMNINSVGLYITSDGHYVRSRYEVLFDNFLSINSISHETGGLISEDTNHLFDFKLKTVNQSDIYIEIWGFSDRHKTEISNRYNKKRKIKEEIYKGLGFKLISLEENDFDQPFKVIYEKLSKLIIDNGIKTIINPIDNVLDYFIGNAYGFEELKKELQPHIEKFDGKMPTSTYLSSLKLEGLIARVQKYGGFPFVTKKLGLLKWDKYDNPELAEMLGIEITWPKGRFEKELDDVVNQFGYIPTQKEFLEIGRGDLLGRVNEAGGAQKIADKYGYMTKTLNLGWSHSHGFDEWGTFKSAIERIIKELGHFPSTKWLRDNKHTSLENYIYKYGGIDAVASELGYKSRSAQLNKWVDKIYCLSELKSLSQNIGKTPTKSDLEKNGLGGLNQALRKHFGGLRNAVIEIDLQPTKLPMGHWLDFENVEKVILDLTEKLGHYPSRDEINSEGFGGMAGAVYKHHGGLINVKKKIFG